MAVPTRWLITGLVLAALVPSLILGALWLGSTSETQPPVAQAPEPQSAAPSAVLTASARLEAKAGETVSFPIALDGTDGVPSRSVIAIKGLPQGSNLSEGRPYGDSEWNLKPDQIGDLHLVLPAGASGEFKLGIALIGPDDKVIAEAETLLEIAPAPVPAPSEQVPIESGLTSPGGIEAAASEASLGDGDAPEETPATIETATAPPGDAQTDTVEPTMEAATAPAGDTQPNTVGQADDGDNGLGTVQPSVFVNMREAPSSSSPVIGVIAKGAKLAALDRKHGWVQVTHPESGKKGWIYSGLLAGEEKAHHRIRRVAPAESEPKSKSFWGRVGDWLSPSAEGR